MKFSLDDHSSSSPTPISKGNIPHFPKTDLIISFLPTILLFQLQTPTVARSTPMLFHLFSLYPLAFFPLVCGGHAQNPPIQKEPSIPPASPLTNQNSSHLP